MGKEDAMTIGKLGTVALIVMAAGALLIGSANLASAAGGRLFRATFGGTGAFTSEDTVSFVGSGSATQMGHITTQGHVALIGPDGSCAGGIANVNSETLTDNDGDTLTVTSQDVSCPIGTGRYHGTGGWSVTGGTGRFANATGTGSLDGYADFNSGTFTISLTGALLPSDA
jgi:hypothetical protein